MQIYGDGDGGGGPGEGHIEFVRRHKVCEMHKAVDFFNDVNPVRNILPTHKGELYYERHQGCYTSQANSKKWNRRIEEMLHKVEWLGAYGYLNGITYDRAKVEEIWKEVLLYQFHDIIPGTSIKRVYDESIARYKVMYAELEEIKDELIEKLSKDATLMAINPISFDRHEYVKNNDNWYEATVDSYSTNALAPVIKPFADLKFADNMLENDKIRVLFNADGSISSLYDKINEKELVKEYFNKFTVYSDPFMYYNAWDINMDYPNMEKWNFKLDSTKSYIDGPQVIRESTYSFSKSKICQKVILTINDAMVKFDTTVDWHEDLKMLRADFVPTVYSDTVKCNIPWGNFDRRTTEDNSVEKAQFEICAQKFINLDDKDYGFALLNNCKYGHRVKNGFLSLALLRAPKFPDPTCDRGTHRFIYAIYPHKEKYEDSDVLARGYALNNELEIIDSKLELDQIIKANKDNIVIETIKVSEDGKGLIVRAYESNGVETTTNLKTIKEFKAFETNMLEEDEKPIKLDKLKFGPYEIKTILLK